MSKFRFPGGAGNPRPDDDDYQGGSPPPLPARSSSWATLVALLLIFAGAYLFYFWFIVRVVVGPGEVLVLLKKNGDASLPGDQVIIPRAPDPKKDAAAWKQWEARYGDANGILEQVHLPGTYFVSPFDYERHVVKTVVVPPQKVGIVIRKFGDKLPTGQVLADPGKNQRGPLPMVLQPAQYDEYANPYAYEVKLVDPIQVDPGHRGIVTIMAGPTPADPNQYLVNAGEQGVQPITEESGFLYVNPFSKRVTPISVQSQRFEMSGTDAIRFPSSDSFEIKLEGFVEWAVDGQRLPLTYVQYAEGSGLIEFLEEQVILPYSRSLCRIVGSQYNARDFIAGDTKLKFQQEFERRLRDECKKQGIIVRQALVRDIVPPDDIKIPINEREIAKQQIKSLEQQILVARSQAELATQTEMAQQNQKIGDANKQVVTITKKAEQDRDVAITQAKQQLEVAKLTLEAARKNAEAQIARGQAEATVILLNKQAEATPLRQQVLAFGDGNAYAQFFFYQRIAPAIRSILSNTDGPFADLFKQFTTPQPKSTEPSKVTEVRP